MKFKTVGFGKQFLTGFFFIKKSKTFICMQTMSQKMKQMSFWQLIF